jgi:hypothetical protein
VSTLLHATVYVFLHNLLNVLVQMANKMGFFKKNLTSSQEVRDKIINDNCISSKQNMRDY